MTEETLARYLRPSTREAGCKIVVVLRRGPRTTQALSKDVGAAKATVRLAVCWLRDILGAPLTYDEPTGWRLGDTAWEMPWAEMTAAAQIAALERIFAPGVGQELIDCILNMRSELRQLKMKDAA